MKTILVPLDGSALAERVLPYIRLLAPALHARVRLLHACTAASYPHTGGARDRRAARDDHDGDWQSWPSWELPREHAESYLDAQAGRLRADGLHVDVEALPGTPAAVIVEVASRPDTLIAMATHGYRGLRRWAFGSVADEVVHATRAPILLVRGYAASPHLRRILVPLDGSDFAHQALPAALDLAIGTGAELIALQSVARSVEEYIAFAPQLPDLRDALGGEVARAFAARGGVCTEQTQVTPTVVVGAAADAIVEEVERRRVDLIVMATHGYQGIKRWLVGSVAEKVFYATDVPLLLMRATEAESV